MNFTKRRIHYILKVLQTIAITYFQNMELFVNQKPFCNNTKCSLCFTQF